MNRSIGTSNFLDTVLLVIILSLFTVVAVFSSAEKEQLVLNNIDITITSSDKYGFVTSENIHDYLKTIGSSIKYNDADINKMEEDLLQSPYIDSVEVYKDIKNTLHFYIVQSKPVMRLIIDEDSSVYVSSKSDIMPLSNQFVADVIPVTSKSKFIEMTYKGNILNEKKYKKNGKNYNNLDNLVNFVEYVGYSDFWNSQIAQININERDEVEIIPRVGSKLIILCDGVDLYSYETALYKLDNFYNKELKNNTNKYITINLKYKDLIVCTK